MKILIDMNLSPVWVNYFQEQDIEAVHWIKIGAATASDTLIFDFAKNNNYIVFTNDLDFGTILAVTNAESPSVFQVRTQDLTPENIGQKVISCLKQFEKELQSGCMLTLNDAKSKVRLLPFR